MRVLFRPINVLLIAGPLGIANQVYDLGGGEGLTFILIALALIPLAGLIAGFTDVLAERVGDRVGGLLEATFGNAAFIILGIVTLSKGLIDVVQASIAGAIISNTLFVLGAAFFFGTMRGKRQMFSKETAQNYAKLLALAVVALVLPAIADATAGPTQGDVVGKEVSAISAAILLLLYLTYLLFDLFHVRDLEYIQQRRAQRAARYPVNPENAPIKEFRAEEGLGQERMTALNARRMRGKETRLNPFVAGFGLVAVLVATVYLSETLVDIARTITEEGEPIRIGLLNLGTLQLSPAFVGLVLIPIIGTAAEHLSAIRSAMDGRTEITITVTAGAAIQVALLAAPLFVLLSFVIAPRPFALLFSPIELAVFALATFLFYLVTEDGEGTWLEGALLLAFYLIFAGTALFLPK